MKHLKHKCLLLTLAALCCLAARGATEDDGIVYSAEYFVGTDPGIGQAKPVTLSTDTTGVTDFDIPAAELDFGLNRLGIRLISRNTEGKYHYSPTVLRSVYRYHAEDAHTIGVEYRLNNGATNFVAVSGDEVNFDIDISEMQTGLNVLSLRAVSQNSETDITRGSIHYQYVYRPAGFKEHGIDGLEYFIGADPGIGKGNYVSLSLTEDGVTALDITAEELQYGLNRLGIRLISVDDTGKRYYAPTVQHSVYRYHAEDAHTIGVEYQLNGGKMIYVDVSSDEVNFDIDVNEMQTGINVLALRAVSQNSELGITRGITHYKYVYRPAAYGQHDIERIEYFWDIDPGKGNATPIEFTAIADSSYVDCDIDYKGLYGPHILCIRAMSKGIWTTLHQQAVVLPSGILEGTILLDPTLDENQEEGIFNTLATLFGALSTRGFEIGLNINVADTTYSLNISEEAITTIQTLYKYLVEKSYYLNMKAEHSATFNFVIPMEFLISHQSELPQIIAAVQTMFSHIVTENISILINGHVYQYDGFQVEPNDLLALKNLYNRLNGANWTTKKWSFISNGRDLDELPGVECDNNGHVTSIDLYNNNLSGVLTKDWNLGLNYLTYLNLSKNNLEGDLSPFLRYNTLLKTLDMSYNCLTEISDTLPGYISSLNLSYQFKTGYSSTELKEDYLDKQNAPRFYISDKQKLAIPSLFTYNYMEMDHSAKPFIYLLDKTSEHNLFAFYSNDEFTWETSKEYTDVQDARYLVEIVDGIGGNSVIPVSLHYVEGDANMSGATDVLDIQHTLNRILGSARKFNFSAANTYEDEIINVQDIVCTVNIVLNQEQNSETANSRRTQSIDNPQAWLYTTDKQLMLATSTEVGALDIELIGVKTSQVGLLLNHSQFLMIGRNTEKGSRYVIFSPTGQAIPAGEISSVLKLSTNAQIATVQVSDMTAEEVSVAIGKQPTSIGRIMDGTLAARFQGHQLLVYTQSEVSYLNLRLSSASGAVIFNTSLHRVARGENAINVNVIPGLYVLEMTTSNGARKIVKLMKRS